MTQHQTPRQQPPTLRDGQGPSLPELIKAFQALNQHDDFGLLTTTILTIACDLFQARAATLLLTNKMTGDLEIAAVKNIPEEIVTQYMQNPARAAALDTNLLQGSDPFHVQTGNPEVTKLASGGYDHFSVLPIRIQEKKIGYLTMAAEQELFSGQTRREKAGVFLEYIAQGIENAYFIFQLRQQNARLELMMTKLQNTQNHLKRTEKMALVGKIAATVAHEIRNPLTVIGTSLQLVYEKMDPQDADYKLFESMMTRVRSVDQTIKELLVFARPLKIEIKPLVLGRALDRVVSFVEKKFSSRHLTIEKEIPTDLPRVLLDEEQAQRVFINLLLNAYAFIPDHGKVCIRASHKSGDPWVVMEFTDNGRGIAPEHINQIFEPFFTTRTEGNGLGLFLVRHVLEEMNSTIEVSSEAPVGAEFRLRLPVATQ